MYYADDTNLVLTKNILKSRSRSGKVNQDLALICQWFRTNKCLNTSKAETVYLDLRKSK